MLKKELINIQLLAGIDDIVTANEKAFEGSNVKEQFSAISTKLSELGYDVLINNKKQAEFVPTSRLSEVVSQRDNFKSQVENLNKDLEAMKAAAKGNEALQADYQKLIDQNTNLLKDLESTKINTEIMLAAKDAINAKDLLAFINFDNIKTNSKGEVMGVDAEIARLKQEKPYLFTTAEAGKKKAGMDAGGGKGDDKVVTGGMNAAIRIAAGRRFSE